MRKVFSFAYLLGPLALFFYSFTQVDLSLTLSKASVSQTFEKNLQHIGFFQRTLSTEIFILILIFLFTYYCYFLRQSIANKLQTKTVWILIILTTLFLALSYNAFSYDLFNYIFDAKIVTHYHLNPYLHRALDFPQDPMLSFMRWTHRFYPYGPSWLALTVPLSYVGSNIFLVTFFLFKVMIGATYLGSVYLIYKISETLFPKDKIFNTVFFALNPLILIEGLVSSHNDFPLMFFGLLSIYLFVKKRKAHSFLSLAFSIGVKFSTFVLIPILGAAAYFEMKGRKINWEKLFAWSVGLSLIALALVIYRTTFQPWYLVLPLSLGALIARKNYILAPAIISSVIALSLYVLLVLITDYDKNYPAIATKIEWSGLFVCVLMSALPALRKFKA